jgi:hypothetical protein
MDCFLDEPICSAYEKRLCHAEHLLELDRMLDDVTIQLNDAGRCGRYMRSMLVSKAARHCNAAVPTSIDSLLICLKRGASRLDVTSVTQKELDDASPTLYRHEN